MGPTKPSTRTGTIQKERAARAVMAAEFSVFHVVHDRAADDWKVEREGSVRPLIWTKSKAAAINAAKRYGWAHGLAQVIVHHEDGSIEAVHNYGDDPPTTTG
jgi:hypothetical protein